MTDTELSQAIRWYIGHYEKKETSKSCFETFVCGHFHTYPRNARFIMQEMENIGLISVSKGIVRMK